MSCSSVTKFEQPPCREGHGGDCPEWLCSRCGAAILIGVWSVFTRTTRRRARAAA